MTKFYRLVSTLLLVASVFVSGTALADSALAYLEAKQKVLTDLIRKPASPSNDKKLGDSFDELLDYQAFAQDSLEEEWTKQTEADRKEFQSLLTTLVQRSYTKGLRDTLDYSIQFKGESTAKRGELVRTVAKHKSDARKEPLSIDYLVHKVDGKWRVFDIITEGESLVSNYRSQFRRVIKKDGFSGLLGKMREKAKEG